MNLILKQDSWSNATAFYLEDLYKQHFDISYDLADEGIVYVHWQDWEWAKSLNRPAIVDHLWDPWENPKIQDTEYLRVIRSDGWFCIANECLWYKDLRLDNYQREVLHPSKTFFMAMNIKKPHRDKIWKAIQPHLGRAVYSYNGIGIQLPNDVNINNGNWQRYVNPEWYDRTNYSVVVESQLIAEPMSHSEKILKPMAFRHPFIVWGPPGILEWIKTWGFDTFDNIIDESYDQVEDDDLRLKMIISEIERLNQEPAEYFEGADTQLRLDNNHKRFYNTKWAAQQFEKYFEQIKQYSHSW